MLNKISNQTNIFILMNQYFEKYANKNLLAFSINLTIENDKKKFTYIPSFLKITKENNSNYIKNNTNGLAIRLGICDKNNAYVILIDIDNKPDNNTTKNGMTKWTELLKIHDTNNKIKTMKQKTGNNGLHYLFRVKEKDFEKLPAMITELNIDGQKYSIDFKGKNQFVIVEPTNYDNKFYKWDDIDEKIQLIPKWMYDLLVSHKNIKPEVKQNKKLTLFQKKSHSIIPLNELKEYIQHLSLSRADNYTDWINLGILYYSLNSNSFSIWDEFSKNSNKYKNGECYEKWLDFSKLDKFDMKSQMATLHKWIYEDNNDEENISDIYNMITTKKVIKNNKFDDTKNNMDIDAICKCSDHNKIKLLDNYCDLNNLYHDKNDTYLKINPDALILMCNNTICKGKINHKEIILTNKEKNNMFSLSQITNYNITLNNNSNNITNNNYYNSNHDDTFILQEDAIFDNKEINKLVFECVNYKSNAMFAKLFYHKCKNILIFDKKNWFICVNGGWTILLTLRNMIEEVLLEEYFYTMENYYLDNEKKRIQVRKTFTHLSQTKIKTDIIFELENNYCGKIIKFNENKNLLAFNNGVYDLTLHIFRDKQPEDKISYSTNYDYSNTYSENREALNNYLSNIQPDAQLREYMIQYFAYCLGEINNNNNFITSIICNHNESILCLLELIMGDYCQVINNTKEICNENNKRLIIVKNENMTRLDKTCYENINKNNILISCDELPELYKYKILLRERFRTINIVKNIKTNIETFKSDFMLLLLDTYKLLSDNNKQIIPTLKNTGWVNNINMNIYLEFVKECITESETHIELNDIYECFKKWYHKNVSMLEQIPKRKFIKIIRKYKTITDMKFNGITKLGVKFSQLKI
jgi:hypothetical protein